MKSPAHTVTKHSRLTKLGYANILKQVRDSEFEQQLHERLELAEKDKANAIELAKEKVGRQMQEAAATKDAEIQDLKAKLEAGEVTQQLAVSEALKAVERERDAFANELKQAEQDTETASELAKASLSSNEVSQKHAIAEAVNQAEKGRDQLKSDLERAMLEKQLAEKSLKDKYETQVKDREDEIGR